MNKLTGGFIAGIIALNCLIGGWSVDFLLGLIGKDIPFIADTVIGIFTAQITFPIAVVGKVLQVCGVF